MSFELNFVGSLNTVFGGGEYLTKKGNYLYQGTLPGYDGEPPLLDGKVINNVNTANNGVVVIDISDPTDPQKIGVLKAPQDTSFGGVESGTLQNGKDILVAGNTPSYCWNVLPDISENLNPKDNTGKIKGKGGVSMWDISNPLLPKALYNISVPRDSKSLERRKLLLAEGSITIDITDGTKTFAQTAKSFPEYIFQNSDDAVIRAKIFKKSNKDYLLLNTLSGDNGLVIFDITDPNAPKHVVNYNPSMNYLLQAKDVCGQVQAPVNYPSYKQRYWEQLDPVNNPNDKIAVQILSKEYWKRVNDASFAPTDNHFLQGINNSVTFHTEYIPAQDALLVSSSLDFFHIDFSNPEKPKINANLTDRTQFPTLKTQNGLFDLVAYYTRLGKEAGAGYHNSEWKIIGGKMIVAITHDNYYVDGQTHQSKIHTGASLWDFSQPTSPKLLSFIQAPDDECHAVHLSAYGSTPILYTVSLTSGIKAYNITNMANPVLVASFAGTFPVIPGYPPFSLPNQNSGFSPLDFTTYPPELAPLNQFTNLPGLPPPYSPIPYTFVPLIFDCVIDESTGYIYLQARTGVTYSVKIAPK